MVVRSCNLAEGVLPSVPLCWFSGPNPWEASVVLVELCVRSLGCAMVLVGPVGTGWQGLVGNPEVSAGRTEVPDLELSALFLTMAGSSGLAEVEACGCMFLALDGK